MNASLLMSRQEPLPPQIYIGPVHGAPEVFRDYVTVRVPSYWDPEVLCWVNVRKGEVNFAEKVRDSEVRAWKQRGWVNRIRDDPDR